MAGSVAIPSGLKYSRLLHGKLRISKRVDVDFTLLSHGPSRGLSGQADVDDGSVDGWNQNADDVGIGGRRAADVRTFETAIDILGVINRVLNLFGDETTGQRQHEIGLFIFGFDPTR